MTDRNTRPDLVSKPRPSMRRVTFAVVALAAVVGLAGVYGMGGFDGNAGGAGKCRAAAARAQKLTPLATGDVAAFAPAATPIDLAGLEIGRAHV